MNFKCTENLITPIYNEFIDNYLPSMDPVFVKIYVYTFKKTYSNEELTVSKIANNLNISSKKVKEAFDFFEEKNIINTQNNEVHFNDLIKNKKNKPIRRKTKRIVMDSRPSYSAKEISLYVNENRKVAELLSSAQSALGKLLTHKEHEIIFSFYDWLHLPFEVIEFLITYSASNGHTNVRYIEKVAIDWSNKDINTIKKAKQHVSLYKNVYNKILKALGINRKQATPVQIDLMKKWTDDFDLDIIVEACNRAAIKNKASFSYVNGILKNWKKNNVENFDDIKELDAIHSKKNQKFDDNKKTKKSNQFNNFDQRDSTYYNDALSKINY